jgi:hypothetical protein
MTIFVEIYVVLWEKLKLNFLERFIERRVSSKTVEPMIFSNS